ncbi:plastocyanin [Natrialbaceae archaeon GCM10025810]|uniref:plastocyanin n=1 Tax=Halovalidus salilacus TaxID=3075124 RepID=UPI003617F67A
MKRRTVLVGSGIALSTGLGGCLDDGDLERTDGSDGSDGSDESDGSNGEGNEQDGDDGEGEGDGEPATSDACATVRAVVEAIVDGEYERAAKYHPHEYEPTTDAETVASNYESMDRPDSIRTVECVDQESNDEFAETYGDEFDVEVSKAVDVESRLDVEIGSTSAEAVVFAVALEIEEEWYAWVEGDLLPMPSGAVDVEGDGTDSVTVTLVDRDGSSTVYVEGGEIDDPDEYRLTEVGESVTLEAEAVGHGRFEVVASSGEGETGRTRRIEGIDVQSPAASVEEWRDVDEIVFSAQTVAWEGLEPSFIAGQENPVLVLEAGREYEIGWTEGDGAAHNLQIRDENDEVVDDYETEPVSDPDDGRFIRFTATREMASYACDPHQSTMHGEIDVRDSL